jgi:putative oxidoreductase
MPQTGFVKILDIKTGDSLPCLISSYNKLMDNWSDIFAPLIGRILMGGFFLWNGIEAALNFANTTGTLASAGSPSPVVLAIVTIAIEVGCGILLVVGLWSRVAALILVVFVIGTAFLQTGPQSAVAQALYLQDMAIVGGLLYVSAYGAGVWSTSWKYKR